MKKLILFSVLILAIYMVVRQSLLGPSPTVSEEGLEELSKERKVRALDELKVLYPPKKITKEAPKKLPKPRKVEKPFFKGDVEEFDRLEKVQYLDERGNPVNLDEEGEL